MRIAQVAPLYESVPPKYYGGTERIVSYLTEELVRQGHDVTLFASGDSVTRARLVAATRRSLRLDEHCVDHARAPRPDARAGSRSGPGEFDVIHFHVDYLHFPVSRRRPMHTSRRCTAGSTSRIWCRCTGSSATCRWSRSRTRSASRCPGRTGTRPIYHGLPADLYRFRRERGSVPRVPRADLAREARRPRDRDREARRDAAQDRRQGRPGRPGVLRAVIEPLLDDPLVEFIGEIGEGEKEEFLGNACALLFPIDWPEPFGLVMIEAMACGTPVIAYRHGSVPEVMEEGRTGFIVDSLDDAVDAARRIPDLSRRRCREVFEQRFTAERMAPRTSTSTSVLRHRASEAVAGGVEWHRRR